MFSLSSIYHSPQCLMKTDSTPWAQEKKRSTLVISLRGQVSKGVKTSKKKDLSRQEQFQWEKGGGHHKKKSRYPFQKVSSWGVPGKKSGSSSGSRRPDPSCHILPESFLQGTQALQGLLGLGQLLLQPLAGALIGGPLQEALHFFHHCPVARGVVEKPYCPVPTGGQKPASDVKRQVSDTLPMDLLKALLFLTPPGIVEMNTAATSQGQDLGIRGECQAARHGASLFKAACPQQVGVLLLLVFHICVPQFPRTILGDRGHPPGVIGESKEVDSCGVALQFKSSYNLLEVTFFPEADFPNFDIGGEAT